MGRTKNLPEKSREVFFGVGLCRSIDDRPHFTSDFDLESESPGFSLLLIDGSSFLCDALLELFYLAAMVAVDCSTLFHCLHLASGMGLGNQWCVGIGDAHD
jgi:hypothetical protein